MNIAASANGTRLFAVNVGGQIYVSNDSGGTWALNSATNQTWYNVVCSADGTQLIAVSISDSRVYISTNTGASWVPTFAPKEYWEAVASSADGLKLVAVAGDSSLGTGLGGPIYTSNDSGASWVQSGAHLRDGNTSRVRLMEPNWLRLVGVTAEVARDGQHRRCRRTNLSQSGLNRAKDGPGCTRYVSGTPHRGVGYSSPGLILARLYH